MGTKLVITFHKVNSTIGFHPWIVLLPPAVSGGAQTGKPHPPHSPFFPVVWHGSRHWWPRWATERWDQESEGVHVQDGERQRRGMGVEEDVPAASQSDSDKDRGRTRWTYLHLPSLDPLKLFCPFLVQRPPFCCRSTQTQSWLSLHLGDSQSCTHPMKWMQMCMCKSGWIALNYNHILLHDTIQVQRMPVCQYLVYGTAVTSEQCQYLHPAQLWHQSINDEFKSILRHSITKFHTH